MRGDDQQSRALYELCDLLLSVLRSPRLALPGSAPRRPPLGPRRTDVTPAGFASLLLGASLALMLCGSITFVLGFVLLPWVLGMVMFFYFLGLLSNISGLGRAVLGPSAPDMPDSIFQTTC